jgi:hypothetical protein
MKTILLTLSALVSAAPALAADATRPVVDCVARPSEDPLLGGIGVYSTEDGLLAWMSDGYISAPAVECVREEVRVGKYGERVDQTIFTCEGTWTYPTSRATAMITVDRIDGEEFIDAVILRSKFYGAKKVRLTSCELGEAY